PSLARYAEVAQVLSGQASARPEDAVVWLERLVAELEIPRLSEYGLASPFVGTIVAKAQAASSMQGNPIPLTVAELTRTLEAAI
ncbi:MAG TPA: iron-containing alcohol dehydrogenase, partial [Polyangiaceae bacterium]|nr:iron-containing alcohol dehydrogenase [Polyangiaceae bacterium]